VFQFVGFETLGEQEDNAHRQRHLTEEGIRDVSAMEFYMKNHQDTALKVTISHSIELIQSLQDGLVDIVYTYIPLYKAGYLCELYAVDELVLVTSSDNEQYANGIYKEELKNTKYFYCNFALQEVGLSVRELFPPHYHFVFEIDNSTKLISYIMDFPSSYALISIWELSMSFGFSKPLAEIIPRF